MKVTNWEKWQTYRKDRSTPPWIKVHRNLLTNPEWVSLTDAEKGQLISIWMIAADKKGEVPDSPMVIQKMAMLDAEPNIPKFIELGFLVAPRLPDGCQMVTSCPQVDAAEADKRQSRGRVETTLSRSRDPEREILLHLNAKTGKNFHPVDTNLNLLTARINEGHSQETILAVIDRKCAEWGDSEKWKKFLRPKTLFTATNFNNYVGELTVKRELTEEEKTDAWIRGEDPDAPGAIEGEFSHVT